MFEHTQTHAVYQKPRLILDNERHDLPLGLYRVGRDPQNNLVLQDSALSRHHFAIDVQSHQAQLIDLGSANGTFVNKKRVRSAWLKDGDKIKIGDQVFSFEAPGFILSHAIFDDGDQTNSKKLSSAGSGSWVSLLALLIASSSLFVQVALYEKVQAPTELRLPEPEESATTVSLAPQQRWQKAISDFRAGDEENACKLIRSLIPELPPNDILRVKAKSFYDRKCIL
ncbi:MAG: FHA domain-containing protein [Deltaproteobacteria bacterium]|nr:FHA domain-containing protein [Deltaproteobacteria bacterium]